MILLLFSLPVSAYNHKLIKINDLKILDYNKDNSILKSSISLNNRINYDSEKITLSYYIPEFNFFGRKQLNLKDLKYNSKIFTVELPSEFKNEYIRQNTPIMFVISYKDQHRIKYRFIE